MFTKNLTEPNRVEIGKILISHEIIKLLPYLNYQEVKKHLYDKWPVFTDDVHIRDFWNLADSLMMGYKLKNIIREVTSEEYEWTLQKNIKVAQIKFSANINGLASDKKTAGEISLFLDKNPDDLKRVTEGTKMEFPDGDIRHLDPILIFKHRDELYVHDGNGRILKSIIDNKDTIDAYIGEKRTVEKSNHWVPTSYLFRLNGFPEGQALLKRIFEESDNAWYEYKQKVNI